MIYLKAIIWGIFVSSINCTTKIALRRKKGNIEWKRSKSHGSTKSEKLKNCEVCKKPAREYPKVVNTCDFDKAYTHTYSHTCICTYVRTNCDFAYSKILNAMWERNTKWYIPNLFSTQCLPGKYSVKIKWDMSY